MRYRAFLLVAFASAVAAGASLSGDVIFLGETHDNPHHHARQAALVEELAPRALVFEMLTEQQAERAVGAARRDEAALRDALQWEESGWPDFSMYYPIFAAAPEAIVFGAAVPRERARAVMDAGLAGTFGDEAARFGLTDPLPQAQQRRREALQMAAHCDALPEPMLPMMVDIQRLRDAALARAALAALDRTGGPVVVITGNGHARKDWGAPALIATAAPHVSVAALGLGEAGQGAPAGAFDAVEITPGAERDDPCEAFRAQRGN